MAFATTFMGIRHEWNGYKSLFLKLSTYSHNRL